MKIRMKALWMKAQDQFHSEWNLELNPPHCTAGWDVGNMRFVCGRIHDHKGQHLYLSDNYDTIIIWGKS